MSVLLQLDLSGWIAAYGYWAVLVLVALESMGLPLPGETALIAAAVYAGTSHELNIVDIIAAAAAGAVIGDNIGYEIGRLIGFPILRRYGPRVGLDERWLKLGQYLFRRYGGAIVFFGRFAALLRTFAALVSITWRGHVFFSTTRPGDSPGRRFLVSADMCSGPQCIEFPDHGIGLFILALTAAIAAVVFIRHHEQALLVVEAERALQGSLHEEPHRLR
jgi:membrane protein YqaA with SNARE-associated domain